MMSDKKAIAILMDAQAKLMKLPRTRKTQKAIKGVIELMQSISKS
jgi:hypothetical protein